MPKTGCGADSSTSLATLTAPTSQVFHVAGDPGHLTQLWRYQTGSKCTDLTAAPAPDPASSLATLSVPQPQQVFYVGSDNHVHQLWYQDHWRHTDLGSA